MGKPTRTAKPRQRFGPGLLVTAAFIGPGTITTAGNAGAGFGLTLAWAILFSVIAAIVLQEMAARVGLVTRRGLGEAVRSTFDNPVLKALSVGGVVVAIALGNAAYQTGNLTGASIGLGVLTGLSQRTLVVLVGVGAAIVLATGSYRWIERVLVLLVLVMSLVFVVTGIVLKPDLGELARGLFVPRMPPDSLVTVIALIGTTVVPYNLFLHASAVHQKWSADVPIAESLRDARRDVVVAVTLGGAVTLGVMITGAACQHFSLTSVADIGSQLEPLLGRWANGFFACGLGAAGLTSAVTAPLAASYAASGALGWSMDLQSWRCRAVWIMVLLVGVVCAVWFGQSPVQAIVFAQAANGMILPLVAVFLLAVVNRRALMGHAANGVGANLLAGGVVLIAGGLGVWKLWSLL